MTDIYVDGDACPVREEIYRVARRLRLVFLVSNGSRPIRPPRSPNVSMVLVGDNAEATDDWIAERIGAIGNALAGSDIARHMRELGQNTHGPAPLTKSDRSRFLVALDTALQAALRETVRS